MRALILRMHREGSLWDCVALFGLALFAAGLGWIWLPLVPLFAGFVITLVGLGCARETARRQKKERKKGN